jgi:hypothetical protein
MTCIQYFYTNILKDDEHGIWTYTVFDTFVFMLLKMLCSYLLVYNEILFEETSRDPRPVPINWKIRYDENDVF